MGDDMDGPVSARSNGARHDLCRKIADRLFGRGIAGVDHFVALSLEHLFHQQKGGLGTGEAMQHDHAFLCPRDLCGGLGLRGHVTGKDQHGKKRREGVFQCVTFHARQIVAFTTLQKPNPPEVRCRSQDLPHVP